MQLITSQKQSSEHARPGIINPLLQTAQWTLGLSDQGVGWGGKVFVPSLISTGFVGEMKAAVSVV